MKKALLIATIVLAPLASPQSAYACSCMYYEDEQERNATYYTSADLVLQGVPIEMSTDDAFVHYSISSEKVWKGQADALVDIVTATDEAACGINLKLNEPVIIFAYKSEGKYHTGLCSGTAKADESLVRWLNMYDSSSSSSSSSEADCEPYLCENGDIFPSCEGDHVINYLVHPCQFSSSESSVSSSSSSAINGFTDVPKTHSNYKAIQFVRDEGIVSGYEDGTYKPNQRINRAEFTKIIVAANFSSEEIDACEADNLFSDVSQSDWFADYVCDAKQHEIIGGYPDGTFKPGNFVNFAEAAKIVVNAFEIETDPEDHLGIWWRPYVFALARIGGLPTTFSDPNQQLTRGDMAEIIYRVMLGMGNQ